MKENLQNFAKKNSKIIILSLIIASILFVLNFRTIGIKDSASIFLATVLLVFDIYLIFKDEKKSLMLFIISFPVLVTARKICYFNLLFISITYESIFVTILFIVKLKVIMSSIKEYSRDKKSLLFKFYITLLLFFIFALNSSIFSLDLFKSLSYIYLGIVVPIMFMLCAISILKKEDIIKVFFSLILSLNFSCIYGVVQIMKDGISIESINKNRALLTFGYHNVNIFAGILITIMPLALEMILYKNKSLTKKQKLMLYPSFALQAFALLITFTRGAWITFLLSALILMISKKYSKLLIAFSAVGLVFIKPLFSLIISRGTGGTTFFANQSSMARMQSIFTDFHMMVKYPFGIGAANFYERYKEFAVKGYLSMPEALRWKVNAADYMLEHAHNLLLQIGVEFGVVTLILFIVLIINRIRVMFKNYSDNRALFTSLIIYIIFSVLTGNVFNHKGVITGTLVLFLIFGLIQVNNKVTLKNKN